MTPPEVGYRTVAGHPVHVREWGAGEVLLLLHGGLDDSDGLWDTFADLADEYRVVAFDRSGHGRTDPRDPSTDYTYDAMVRETAALLEQTGPAHVLGHSDGGNIALLLALSHPELVRSIIAFGANYHHDGVRPEVVTPPPREAEPRVRATVRMWATSPSLTVAHLRRIQVPALIAVGEDEPIRPEHTRSMARAIEQSVLWEQVGADHDLPKDPRWREVTRTRVREFLARTSQPVRETT